jgi:hypothetical protein
VSSGETEPQVPPLRSPGFPVECGGVDHHHVVFLKKTTYVVVVSNAKQEIRVRSGRDDNSSQGQSIPAEAVAGTTELSSRPEQSVVEGPAVRFPGIHTSPLGNALDNHVK